MFSVGLNVQFFSSFSNFNGTFKGNTPYSHNNLLVRLNNIKNSNYELIELDEE
jgi:hypothetical protein